MSKNLKKVHWTKDALCKFDKKFTSFHIDDINFAKSVCQNCTVQVECIIANAEVDGTFMAAGLSKYDRLLIQWEKLDSKYSLIEFVSEYHSLDLLRSFVLLCQLLFYREVIYTLIDALFRNN